MEANHPRLITQLDVRAGERNGEDVASVVMYDTSGQSLEVVLGPHMAIELALGLVNFVRLTAEWVTTDMEEPPVVDRSQ